MKQKKQNVFTLQKKLRKKNPYRLLHPKHEKKAPLPPKKNNKNTLQFFHTHKKKYMCWIKFKKKKSVKAQILNGNWSINQNMGRRKKKLK